MNTEGAKDLGPPAKEGRSKKALEIRSKKK
jgi:hypothetical protein